MSSEIDPDVHWVRLKSDVGSFFDIVDHILVCGIGFLETSYMIEVLTNGVG